MSRIRTFATSMITGTLFLTSLGVAAALWLVEDIARNDSKAPARRPRRRLAKDT